MMKIRILFLSLLVLFAALPCLAEIVELPDGAMIYYQVKGQGRPILFVHGWAVSGKFWNKQMESLSKDAQVIAMDLRGHGNSSKVLHGHTVPQYARDVRAVIEALNLNEVALIGWSLAGPVVLEYWKQFRSDRVKALGLVEMTPFAFSPEPWNSHGLRNYNYNGMNGFLAAFQENRRASAEGFINLIFKTALAPQADMEWMMREHLKTPTPVAVAIYSDHLMRDYTGVLKTITVPTIVFSGDSQVFRRGIEMGKYVSGQIPGSKFVPFEKSGHLLFYEESDKFNSFLMEFLKEIK